MRRTGLPLELGPVSNGEYPPPRPGPVAAEAAPGKTVAVVGDGAVGLLAILAAEQLGAERIIAMSRHESRQRLAREFGATDIVEADAGDAAGRTRWFSGLTERRIHLNEGREFDLPFKKHPARVNHMSIGYAEIDGKPARVLPEGEKKPQLVRKVKYTESLGAQSGPLATSPATR